MKGRAAIAAAAAATSAAAQSSTSMAMSMSSSAPLYGYVAPSSSPLPSPSPSPTPSPSPIYFTTTIDDCDSTAPATMITITNGVTITYCPQCEMESLSSMIPHTTVYTTYYDAICSTGSTWYPTTSTYTVTESCTEAIPTWSSGTDYVPQGFVTTVVQCDMCETPMAMTITEPCGCEETESASGAPRTGAAATTTPASGTDSGSAPSATSATGAGSAPSATSGWSSESSMAGSAPSATSGWDSDSSMPGSAPSGTGSGSAPSAGTDTPPYPMSTTARYDSPAAPSSWSSGVAAGNTSNITPFIGGASALGMSGSLSVLLGLGVGVAGLAFLL